MVIEADEGSPDPEKLQLQELSPLVQKVTRFFAEDLFLQWLSLPETGQLVKSLIADAKKDASLDDSGNVTGTNSASCHSLPSMFPRGSTPPLSLRISSGSSRKKPRVDPSLKGSPLKLVNEPGREVIPQFYFKSGRPPPDDLKENFLCRVNEIFSSHLDGVQIHEFKSVTKEICKLPSFLSTALFKKIDINCNGNVSREQFIDYWITNNMLTMDLATQVYTILKEPERNYLVQDDFKPALQELLATHPGLAFLLSTPEFQERYGS